VLDFQDAMRGPWAYDVVSLLQDARLNVPEDIEQALLDHYRRQVAQREPDFDAAAFDTAYAVLGAQRNTKLLGIFRRLALRDGKTAYLAHIPRIWRYLERNLQHSALADIASWFDAHFPPAGRERNP
jgi:aminoglycoside/choline kinase family phosphotransferase